MSGITSSHWRKFQNYVFPHRCLGDQYVIYHPGSGDTHLISEATMYIYKLLQENDILTTTDIVERISIEFEDDSINDLYNYTANILEQLKKFAIVEQVG